MRGGVTRNPPQYLGAAEITSPATTTATSYADIAGLSKAVMIGTRPVMVMAHAPSFQHSVSGGTVQVILTDGANNILAYAQMISAAANQAVPFFICRVYSPAAGAITFKLRWQVVTAGTATMQAGATYPAQLHVHEL